MYRFLMLSPERDIHGNFKAVGKRFSEDEYIEFTQRQMDNPEEYTIGMIEGQPELWLSCITVS